ncbi:response regulator transcription factor [Streptosporangium canum]|uniref:response regulator transcription factor n=1 Tax=Streptosporangium canum TaxID=324952 RepID=UPI00342E2754
MVRILIIEDDPSVRDGMELVLRRYGHEVLAAATGEAGLARLRDKPDILVLDLMLPGMDGFEVCRRARAAAQLPIIMLTARGDDFDVVGGLEAGADDYVVKPVTGRVLEARIRAVLRRAEPVRGAAEDFGDLVIDRDALTVALDGRPLTLAPTELRLLLELSAAPGRVLSREQLLELVWNHDYLGDSRLVDACVARLRARIGPRHVQTVRGFGYRFDP